MGQRLPKEEMTVRPSAREGIWLEPRRETVLHVLMVERFLVLTGRDQSIALLRFGELNGVPS